MGGRRGGGRGYGGGPGNYRGNSGGCGYNNMGGMGNMGMNNMNNNMGNLNIGRNDLMNLMSVMASNFNMNPPPPPPVRMLAGDLRVHHAGMLVELTGRMIKKRVTRFVELRDRNGGACQLVILEDKYPRIWRRMYNMPDNTNLTVIGVVMRRPMNSCNQTMVTGEIEVEVQDIYNIGFQNSKRSGEKRSFSTMSAQHNVGITSTEYKIAKSENILKYFENRELTCNDLRSDDIGKTVTMVGWVPPSKNSKFLQLKDGYGQTQIIVEDQALQDSCLSAPENTCIQIVGKVLGRPRNNVNMKYQTGEVEVMVESLKILNPDDPYDGPIRIKKEKIQKLSIEDYEAEQLEHEEAAAAAAVAKNGEVASQESEAGDESVSGENSANGEASTTTGGISAATQTAPAIVKVADTNKFADRTHNCGELTVHEIGEKVVLCGWLEFQRMGKFFVLRDGYGQTQVLLTDKVKKVGETDPTEGLSLESIIRVEGTVIPRPAATVNPKMKTGHIEVDASSIEVLNVAKKNLPFEVRKFNRAGENLRLRHRYLDLRFQDMQHNLRLRSSFIMRMREYLINYLGFVEVETPTLFRRTPGGAQEFVVPTRKPGLFYSLVQSPQQFKQMLMSGGIDRYFQVARCYRDEATRPDRQPEFTQLDVELSFTKRDHIMQLIEEVLRYSWPKDMPKIQTPFRRMTYDEAMESYGCDKPDTRFDLKLNNVSEIVEKNETFKQKYPNFAAYAIVARGSESYLSGMARKHFESVKKEFDGILFIRKFQNYKDVLERLNNLLGAEVGQELIEKFDLEENDLLFLAIGSKPKVLEILSRVRIEHHNDLVESHNVRKPNDFNFLWVVDFPMFSRNAETNTLESVHHPFTAPHEDDTEKFVNAKKEDLEEIRSQAYDLVLNGQEVGGGSIRIHDRDMQHFVLEQILKIPHEHLEHLLEALESGCPPHGGIALGLDRLVAIMCRARTIRDVIAFPKSLYGKDPLSKAPVAISQEERDLYHLGKAEDVKSNADEDEALEMDTEGGDGERSEAAEPVIKAEEEAATKEEAQMDVSQQEEEGAAAATTAEEKPLPPSRSPSPEAVASSAAESLATEVCEEVVKEEPQTPQKAKRVVKKRQL